MKIIIEADKPEEMVDFILHLSHPNKIANFEIVANNISRQIQERLRELFEEQS